MDFRKCTSFGGPLSPGMRPLLLPNNGAGVGEYEKQERAASHATENDIDVDLGEIYFLIMHFLSSGPCQRTFVHLQNELLEHQLLPRRYHAWFSRSSAHSGNEEDNGISFPLNYSNLVERYPHVSKDHLVRLMKKLMLTVAPPLRSKIGIKVPSAADVPTLLGTGSFSLLDCDGTVAKKPFKPLPAYLLWPHMHADQVRGLFLREIGGGFRKHHRAPSIHSACYAIAKPSMMVKRMQNIKKLRGHRVAVYCAIFDRSGRYVITGSDDRLVKIWSMETAFCLASCRGHEGDITDLAVSSNNALVASASNDFVIRVWRLPDGVPISVLRGHTGAVTAIAFSPRPSSVYQLLSSSDDGTCRIWDARYSQCTPRIYLPKPPDAVAGRSNAVSAGEPSSSMNPQSHRILCCAYNANGTVFVTGSSDTFARVWNACKTNTEESEQPVHEMDILAGHENDVNYVQFSGCAVATRSSISDTLKEENIPKFKNYWFSHDNIVTCSRDGSAIIWVPRSRRSNGKGGRWTRAYHLKVPPPPLPPQPPRGGPRQRFLPTPRGVNMIMWSLDNRFVLAAIMDCRICVWNAADGSLVHCLTGHSASSYVLDVHPWNPRIAMSAGYDGKAIVWDIWEGTPIQVYEIGRVKLVDGKFSPDGTSIVFSDDFGQIHLVNTGQGESQKDAKYDQFFLGDYRPLIRDTLGNVLDQESQQPPHRRNFQDPLCDSSLIPYSEPYQTMYQKRRLGALGMEWRPSPTRFAVGPDFSLGQDYQVPPLADLERMMEPLPEFIDAMYWEPDNEIMTDDNDSEYNVAEEYSSEGERQSLSIGFYSDPDCSAADSEDERNNKDGRRRSGRNRRSTEVEPVSSGKRTRKRNLDDCEGSSSRIIRSKKPKSRQKGSKQRSSRGNALRPQRVAARNALTMFSQYSGTSTGEEDDDDLEDSSSERDSGPLKLKTERSETERKLPSVRQEECRNENGQIYRPAEVPECQPNAGNRKRLVLKFMLRDSKKSVSSENVKTEADAVNSSSKHSLQSLENKICSISKDVAACSGDAGDVQSSLDENRHNLISEGLGENACNTIKVRTAASEDRDAIKWGEVKVRSAACLKSDVFPTEELDGSNPSFSFQQENMNSMKRDEGPSETNTLGNDSALRAEHFVPPKDAHMFTSNELPTVTGLRLEGNPTPVQESPPKRSTILRIKTKGLPKLTTPGGFTGDETEDDVKQNKPNFGVRREHEGTTERISSEDEDVESDFPEKATDAVRRKRSMKMKATSREPNTTNFTFRFRRYENAGTSRSLDFPRKVYNEHLKHQMPTSKLTVRSKSNKTRMDDVLDNDQGSPQGSNSGQGKQSWLMLSEREEGYRYIPQMGDEVIYLRQGHQEFIESSGSSDKGPWRVFKTLRAVEICRIVGFEYAASPGSGDSCCKLTLQFVDQASSVLGKSFKLTLPELVNFPDFLVEKTWYENSMSRKWIVGDKCQVWWREDTKAGGSWWEGEIVSSQAKSYEFPDSPWERYDVHYQEDAGSYHHSPWELHDPDVLRSQRLIDGDSKDILLSLLASLERSVAKSQDYYGFQKLKELGQKPDFCNRFPVPICPKLIQQRLEISYFRSVEAAKHDIRVMLSNAQSYYASNSDMSTKMRRLSHWFDQAFSKL
ncbi:bromodomain and WD repeat-containing protein 3 [Punica granatum]|uniref:Bromodomain and WD repeat-containing protein 3 n=3 Tax=Punica granatum TaxID=22663 RepID=A0A6P8E153_PUNGR|nr:bromodomain and WD repeat-containing protein 3 [Punica granatum]